MRGVHPQCHIGTDTISLTRLGEHDSVPWNALPGQMVRLDGVSGASPVTR